MSGETAGEETGRGTLNGHCGYVGRARIGRRIRSRGDDQGSLPFRNTGRNV